MTQIFFSWDFFSSDDTEFIRRLTAETITHGFSRMRPVRSLQIPPEVGKSPTDFTDLHRFFLGRFFCHADFADDADFFLMGFYSSDDTEFIRRFPAETIIHGFSQMRPVRSLQIPPEVGKSPTDFTDIHRFFLGRFFVTQISQMTQIFSHEIFSSDFTEFIRRFPAETITHGFSQMRPVRSLQIPPESGKYPTDFTDIHRFFLGCFLSRRFCR